MLYLLEALYLEGAYDLFLLALYVWYIMHSRLLSCIVLYTCDGETYVTCVLSTLFYICHVTWLCSLVLLTFYSDSNELYFMYSYLIHIFWLHHVGLGHISMPNPFVLIVKSLYELSMLKTSLISFTCSRLCCHQSPKKRRLKASRPLVGFRWLMTLRDYYD